MVGNCCLTFWCLTMKNEATRNFQWFKITTGIERCWPVYGGVSKTPQQRMAEVRERKERVKEMVEKEKTEMTAYFAPLTLMRLATGAYVGEW